MLRYIKKGGTLVKTEYLDRPNSAPPPDKYLERVNKIIPKLIDIYFPDVYKFII